MNAAASGTVARVLDGRLCAGCGLCAALAPDALTMRYAEGGFLRPVATGKVDAAADAAIAAVCPGVGLQQEPGGRTDDPLWGPYVAMHAGHATDSTLRRAASSGGALSALLVHLLDTGRVDAVVQTAPSAGLAIGNRTVVSRSREEIVARSGSRYAPSAPLVGLEHLLGGTEHTYAFVGKPCDIAALRALERRDPRVSRRFPVLLSFFCAGVPSLAGAREILNRLGVAETDLAAFRYRGNGWPGFATATRKDGREARMSYADSWGGILSRHVQFRCKICPDGTGGFADVVCADAWETDERGYPLFEEEDGVSLVVSRTAKGAELVQSAHAAGAVALVPFAAERLSRMQPGQVSRRRTAAARLAALRLLGRPWPRYRGFHLGRNAMRSRKLSLVRNFLGTLRRALQNRL